MTPEEASLQGHEHFKGRSLGKIARSEINFTVLLSMPRGDSLPDWTYLCIL